MDFIEDVLRQSAKSNRSDWVASLLSIIVFFIVNIAIIVIFNGSKVLIFMLFAGVVIAPIIGYVLGRKLSKILFRKNRKIQFEKSRLYKKLEKSGYLSEFKNTIDEEMKLENIVKYSCSFLGVGLLVTKTWFIYIDMKRPIVVKTEDVLRISEETSTDNSARYLCLQLKDNTVLRMKKISYEDLELEMRNKFPRIMLGIGIMDEQ